MSSLPPALPTTRGVFAAPCAVELYIAFSSARLVIAGAGGTVGDRGDDVVAGRLEEGRDVYVCWRRQASGATLPHDPKNEGGAGGQPWCVPPRFLSRNAGAMSRTTTCVNRGGCHDARPGGRAGAGAARRATVAVRGTLPPLSVSGRASRAGDGVVAA